MFNTFTINFKIYKYSETILLLHGKFLKLNLILDWKVLFMTSKVGHVFKPNIGREHELFYI